MATSVEEQATLLSRDDFQTKLRDEPAGVDWELLSWWVRKESEKAPEKLSPALLRALNTQLNAVPPEKFTAASLANWSYVFRLVDDSDDAKTLLNTTRETLIQCAADDKDKDKNQMAVNDAVLGSVGLNGRFLTAQAGLREQAERFQDFVIDQSRAALRNAGFIPDPAKSLAEQITALSAAVKNNRISGSPLLRPSPIANVMYGLNNASPNDKTTALLDIAILHAAARTFLMEYELAKENAVSSDVLAGRHQFVTFRMANVLEGIGNFPQHAAVMLPILHANINAIPGTHQNLAPLAVAEALNQGEKLFAEPGLAKKTQAVLASLYALSGQPNVDGALFQYAAYRRQELYRLMKQAGAIRTDNAARTVRVGYHSGLSNALADSHTKALLRLVARDDSALQGIDNIEFIHGKGQHILANLGQMREGVKSSFSSYGVNPDDFAFGEGSTTVSTSQLWNALAKSASLPAEVQVDVAYVAAKRGQLFNNAALFNRFLEVPLSALDINGFLTHMNVLVEAKAFVNEDLYDTGTTIENQVAQAISNAERSYLDRIRPAIHAYPFSLEEKIRVWDGVSTKFAGLENKAVDENIKAAIAEDFNRLPIKSLAELSESRLIQLNHIFCDGIEQAACKTAVTTIATLLADRYPMFNQQADGDSLYALAEAFDAALEKPLDEGTRHLLTTTSHQLKRNEVLKGIHARLDTAKGMALLAQAQSLQTSSLQTSFFSAYSSSLIAHGIKSTGDAKQAAMENAIEELTRIATDKKADKKIIALPVYPLDTASGQVDGNEDPNRDCTLFIYDRRNPDQPEWHIYAPLNEAQWDLTKDEGDIANHFNRLLAPDGDTAKISVRKHFFDPQLRPSRDTIDPENALAIEVVAKELVERLGGNDDYQFGEIYQGHIDHHHEGETTFFQAADKDVFIAALLSALKRDDQKRASALVIDAHARIAPVENGLNAIDVNGPVVVRALLDSSPHWRAYLEKTGLSMKGEAASPHAETLRLIKEPLNDTKKERTVTYFFDAMNQFSPFSEAEKDEKAVAWVAYMTEQEWSPDQRKSYSLIRDECISRLSTADWQPQEGKPPYPTSKREFAEVAAIIRARLQAEQKAESTIEKRTEKLIAGLAKPQPSQVVTTSAASKNAKRKKKKKRTSGDEAYLSKPVTAEIKDILDTFYRCLNSENDTEALAKFKTLVENKAHEIIYDVIGPHILASEITNIIYQNRFLQAVTDNPAQKSYEDTMAQSGKIILKGFFPVPDAQQKKQYRAFIEEYSATGKLPENFKAPYLEPKHKEIVLELMSFWHEYTKAMDGNTQGKSFDDLYKIALEKIHLLPRANEVMRIIDWLDETAFPLIEDKIQFNENKAEWLINKAGRIPFLIRQKNFLERKLNDLTDEQKAALAHAIKKIIMHCKEARSSDDFLARYNDVGFLKSNSPKDLFTYPYIDSIRAAAGYFLMQPNHLIPNDPMAIIEHARRGYREILKAKGWKPDEEIKADADKIKNAAYALFSGKDEISDYFNSPDIKAKFDSNAIEFIPPEKVFGLAYCIFNQDDFLFSSEALNNRRSQFIEPVLSLAFQSPKQVIIFPLNPNRVDLPERGVNEVAHNWVLVVLDKRYPIPKIYTLKSNSDPWPKLEEITNEIISYGNSISHPIDESAYISIYHGVNASFQSLTHALIHQCDAAAPLLANHKGNNDGAASSPLAIAIGQTLDLKQSPKVAAALLQVEDGVEGAVETLTKELGRNAQRAKYDLARIISADITLRQSANIFSHVEQLDVSNPEVIPTEIAEDILAAADLYLKMCQKPFKDDTERKSNEDRRRNFITNKQIKYIEKHPGSLADSAGNLLLALVHYIDKFALTTEPQHIPDWTPGNIKEARDTALGMWKELMQEKAAAVNEAEIRKHFVSAEKQFLLAAISHLSTAEHERKEHLLMEALVKRPVKSLDDLVDPINSDKELKAALDSYRETLFPDAVGPQVANDQLLRFILKSTDAEAEASLDSILKKRERSYAILSSSSLAHLREQSDSIKWILKQFRFQPFADHLSEYPDSNHALLKFNTVAVPSVPELSTEKDIACVHEMLKCWWRHHDAKLPVDIDVVRKKMLGIVGREISQIHRAQEKLQQLKRLQAPLHMPPALPETPSAMTPSISSQGEFHGKEEILHELQSSRDETVKFSTELQDIHSDENSSSTLKEQVMALQEKMNLHQKNMDDLLKRNQAQDKSVEQQHLLSIRECLNAYRKESIAEQVNRLQLMQLKEIKEALRSREIKISQLQDALDKTNKKLREKEASDPVIGQDTPIRPTLARQRTQTSSESSPEGYLSNDAKNWLLKEKKLGVHTYTALVFPEKDGINIPMHRPLTELGPDSWLVQLVLPEGTKQKFAVLTKKHYGDMTPTLNEVVHSFTIGAKSHSQEIVQGVR